MARITEQRLIDKVASHEQAIDGVKRSYGFAKNPDTISQAVLPCVIHYQPRFTSDLFAHHNVHRNVYTMQSIMFVNPRESMGGKLRYIENSAIPFLYKWRLKFQSDSVIRDILGIGLQRAYNFTGEYGAGGTLLSYNGTEYIGAVFTFEFSESIGGST